MFFSYPYFRFHCRKVFVLEFSCTYDIAWQTNLRKQDENLRYRCIYNEGIQSMTLWLPFREFRGLLVNSQKLIYMQISL